jgi:polyphosphate glucokinase
MNVFGIDVGGSGIKGAPVDTETGELAGERIRVKTPKPARPEAIVATAVEVVGRSGWAGPVGCGFPAVIKGRLEQELGDPVHVINDGDAAGLAEMRWGAGRGKRDRGRGADAHARHGNRHLPLRGGPSRPQPRARAHQDPGHGRRAPRRRQRRKRDDLGWKEYAKRLDEYLHRIEDLLWPDLIVTGGGISKKSEKFFPHLTARTKIVAAEMSNEAGIAGAALAGVPKEAAA